MLTALRDLEILAYFPPLEVFEASIRKPIDHYIHTLVTRLWLRWEVDVEGVAFR